ncbi:NB-ARC domain containing protein [Parasponia andersonii]|uniref:NB-ARC domain containing protein n=1 Tax=Parasponia andersonii TaxID=3476 RepID=A0A2P5DH89_PARAD|nr:NB-ARC domain containing protein [Parasponia andersonii]
MGGIGKTTLAQVVYNDDRVKEHFDFKVCVFVSDDFDVFAITKTIFEAVTSQTCNINGLNKLQVELKKASKEERFLFVHDDVWNNNWDGLKCPFESGAHGSKIIVTTRNERVASMKDNVPPYHLGAMTDEDCWRLFAKHGRLGCRSGFRSNWEKNCSKVRRASFGSKVAWWSPAFRAEFKEMGKSTKERYMGAL